MKLNSKIIDRLTWFLKTLEKMSEPPQQLINILNGLLDKSQTEDILVQAFNELLKLKENHDVASNTHFLEIHYLLGECYYNGIGVAKDIEKAYELFSLTANKGLAAAQVSLGLYHQNESNGKKDLKQAFELINLAANQDYGFAYYILALCYLQGLGTIKDIKKAFEYYTKASNQGHPLSSASVGWFYLERWNDVGISLNVEYAIEMFRLGEKHDVPLAHAMLGKCYFKGIGLDRNDQKAFEHFTKAIDEGYSSAEIHEYLGICYGYGRGVAEDSKRSTEHLQIAADKGLTYSQYLLGFQYKRSDRKLALKYLTLAADKGNTDAEYELANLYINEDTERSVELYKRAAEKGHVLSQYELGYYYLFESALLQDKKQAFEFFSQAANQGMIEAQTELSVLQRQVNNSEKDRKNNLELLSQAPTNNNSKQRISLGAPFPYRPKCIKDETRARIYYSIAAWQDNSGEGLIALTRYYLHHFIEEYCFLGKLLLQEAVRKGHKQAIEMMKAYLAENGISENEFNSELDSVMNKYFELEKKIKLDSANPKDSSGDIEETETIDEHDSSMLMILAFCYLMGLKRDKDLNKAIQYYKLAEKNREQCSVELFITHWIKMQESQNLEDFLNFYRNLRVSCISPPYILKLNDEIYEQLEKDRDSLWEMLSFCTKYVVEGRLELFAHLQEYGLPTTLLNLTNEDGSPLCIQNTLLADENYQKLEFLGNSDVRYKVNLYEHLLELRAILQDAFKSTMTMVNIDVLTIISEYFFEAPKSSAKALKTAGADIKSSSETLTLATLSEVNSSHFQMSKRKEQRILQQIEENSLNLSELLSMSCSQFQRIPKSFYNEKVFMTLLKVFLSRTILRKNTFFRYFFIGYLGQGLQNSDETLMPLPLEERIAIRKQILEFIKKQDEKFFKQYGQLLFDELFSYDDLYDLIFYMISERNFTLDKDFYLYRFLNNYSRRFDKIKSSEARFRQHLQYQDNTTSVEKKLFLEKINFFLKNGSKTEILKGDSILSPIYCTWILKYFLEHGANPINASSDHFGKTVITPMLFRAVEKFETELFGLYLSYGFGLIHSKIIKNEIQKVLGFNASLKKRIDELAHTHAAQYRYLTGITEFLFIDHLGRNIESIKELKESLNDVLLLDENTGTFKYPTELKRINTICQSVLASDKTLVAEGVFELFQEYEAKYKILNLIGSGRAPNDRLENTAIFLRNCFNKTQASHTRETAKCFAPTRSEKQIKPLVLSIPRYSSLDTRHYVVKSSKRPK